MSPPRGFLRYCNGQPQCDVWHGVSRPAPPPPYAIRLYCCQCVSLHRLQLRCATAQEQHAADLWTFWSLLWVLRHVASSSALLPPPFSLSGKTEWNASFPVRQRGNVAPRHVIQKGQMMKKIPRGVRGAERLNQRCIISSPVLNLMHKTVLS